MMETEGAITLADNVRHRSSYTKSTKGCNTCKDRHVKCDETRPVCKRCSKSGRPCSYAPRPHRYKTRDRERALRFHYYRLQRPFESLTVSLPAFSGFDDDLKAFQFFLQQTSLILDDDCLTHHWIEDLLRFQAQDVMVHRSCLAVGALHRSLLDVQYAQRTPSGPDAREDHQVQREEASDVTVSSSPLLRYASRLYGDVLRMLHQALQSTTVGPTAVKYTSVMLSLFSSLSGRPLEYETHLMAGIRLSNPLNPPNENQGVDGILHGMAFMSQFLSDGWRGLVHQSLLEKSQVRISTPRAMSTIRTVREARDSLHLIIAQIWMFMLRHSADSSAPAFEREATRAIIQTSLAEWWQTFLVVASAAFTLQEAGIALLIAQYHMACIAIKSIALAPGEEFTFSVELRAEHETVVTSIARFTELNLQTGGVTRSVFSYQTGVIPMLYLIARFSDDSHLRQRIIDLLRRVPSREGAWSATSTARLIENLPHRAREN